MKQFGLGLDLSTRWARRREFLDEMERVVPSAAPAQLVQPCYPRTKTGRPPFGLETIRRFHHLLVTHDLATDTLRVVNDILQAEGLLMKQGTAVIVNDVTQAGALLQGQEEAAFGDAGHQGVLKRQLGYTKLRYRGLATNTAQVVTLLALSKLRMARWRLIGAAG